MAERSLANQSVWCRGLVPATAALLTASLLSSPEMLAATRVSKDRKSAAGKASEAKLTTQEKTLHALDRLTFGARPGDVAEVTREGLESWFQEQLHPERIPDQALAARLARYPAMQLSQAELVARFPTPGMLRQFSNGKLPSPTDPMEQTIYSDAAFSYREKREAKQAARTAATGGDAGKISSAGSMSTPNAMSSMGDGAPPPTEAEPDPALREQLLHLAAPVRFDRLRAMTPETMQAFRASLKGPEQQRLLADMTPLQMEEVEAMRAPERMVSAEVLSTRLLRDVYSERQLQAVMTDFWLNHFSVFLHKNQNEPYLLPAYEREAILPHALGRFEDLLVATAKSPAMLVYLDNWESLGPDSKAALRAGKGAAAPKGINENYARELMELHTLGVGGGYSQADIVEVAKCFTGWTIDRPAEGGEFFFNENRHEPGAKTVLGHTIPAGGVDEGLQVLHLLATSPATAHFVSLKLAQRFVSDTPPPALVDRMAGTFLKTDGDIAAVLSTLFHSREFWSPGTVRVKVKTPLEFVASALRATNAEITNPASLVQSLDRLGMPLYGKQTPNGYSALAEDWVSSNALLTRMNFALVLSSNRLGGTRVDWPALLARAPGGGVLASSGEDAAKSAPDLEEEGRMEYLLLGRPAAPQTRKVALEMAATPDVQQRAAESFRAVPVSTLRPQNGAAAGTMQARAGQTPAPPAAGAEAPLATMGGLLLGSPDFQRR